MLDEEKALSVTQYSLVGRLVSRRTLLQQVIHPIIRSGWRFVQEFKIDNIGQNCFLFTFDSLMDKEKILGQAPWNFRGSLMVLKEWQSKATINDVDLSHTLFWIQIHGLPLKGLAKENALWIGSKIGKMQAVDDTNGNRLFLRVQVKVNTDEPL